MGNKLRILCIGWISHFLVLRKTLCIGRMHTISYILVSGYCGGEWHRLCWVQLEWQRMGWWLGEEPPHHTPQHFWSGDLLQERHNCELEPYCSRFGSRFLLTCMCGILSDYHQYQHCWDTHHNTHQYCACDMQWGLSSMFHCKHLPTDIETTNAWELYVSSFPLSVSSFPSSVSPLGSGSSMNSVVVSVQYKLFT